MVRVIFLLILIIMELEDLVIEDYVKEVMLIIVIIKLLMGVIMLMSWRIL